MSGVVMATPGAERMSRCQRLKVIRSLLLHQMFETRKQTRNFPDDADADERRGQTASS